MDLMLNLIYQPSMGGLDQEIHEVNMDQGTSGKPDLTWGLLLNIGFLGNFGYKIN